jgi:hypothetical protein
MEPLYVFSTLEAETAATDSNKVAITLIFIQSLSKVQYVYLIVPAIELLYCESGSKPFI